MILLYVTTYLAIALLAFFTMTVIGVQLEADEWFFPLLWPWLLIACFVWAVHRLGLKVRTIFTRSKS